MIKKHRFLAGVGLLAVVAVVGAIRAKRGDGGNFSDPIKRGTLVEAVYGIGTVTAKNRFALKLGVTSTVRALHVKEGDYVRRGQRLVDLDGTGGLSAPFDGTITYLPAKVGETVFAQSVILNLVDLLDRYIVVSLEQRGAVRVRQGQKAKLSFDSMREQSFEGVVESVYSNDTNFLVRIGVRDLPPQLLPGMTADVAIAIGERKDVMTIPVAAVELGKVYVKRDGAVEAVPVTLGIVDGMMAEVKSGELRQGEQLLIRKKVGP